MPEFKDIQSKLQQARNDRNAGETAVFHAKEKLKKLQRAKQQIRRSFSEKSETFQTLLQRERSLKKELSRQESHLSRFRTAETGLLEAFFPFTDPREHIQQLHDEYPVLLFPVRLETRFKKVPLKGNVIQHQLWVRIFPDECSIDTFDDILSETEITKARNYWTSLWKAGKGGNESVNTFIQNKRKGAWRELMGILNAGRAYWIIQNYQPENAANIPARDAESDILLIIPTEDLPDQATQDALKEYWHAIFLAQGDAEASNNAFAALVSETGQTEEQVRQLIQTYTPPNINEQRDETAPAPHVTVSFLVFPKLMDTNTKLLQWSRASRVTTFPDKFVLLGFQKDNPIPVINELGNRIPDPLIVGPDSRDDINEVLKAVYGDEFEKLTDDEKAVKYVEYLTEQSDTRWLFDFDEAVDNGLGFKINLSEQDYNEGFERLFVLGIKLSADKEEGRLTLERLIHNHHFGDSGFSIIPQGTPTNNTEDTASGYSEIEDAEEAYSRYFSEESRDDPADLSDWCDGKWLAGLLGINIEDSTLNMVANYYRTDQLEARAMNTALWNATLGYFMESMLTPVFNDAQRELVRWFFIDYVSGRGRLPAIRIGNQPYGILPVSTISNILWLDDKLFTRQYFRQLPVLKRIYAVLKKIEEDWQSIIQEAAYIGETGDPHKILLKVLGLHATSVEFDQRYAEGFLHLCNMLNIQTNQQETVAALNQWNYKEKVMNLLKSLGYEHDEKLNPNIPILEKFFLTNENDIKKHLIDDRPLSEKQGIRAYTTTGQNYIEWLIENALNSHQKIRLQNDFIDNKKPDVLLYDMLRHAINLEFSNSSLKLYEQANILNPSQVNAARIDADFIGIQAEQTQLESKWDLLYREDTRIADKGTLLVDYVSGFLKNKIVNTQTRHLHEIIDALQLLKNVPTARLERAFVEHLDCCTYRLDAWLLGLVNLQLEFMRFRGENETASGIYLGAYGWVEHLKPENKNLTPVKLAPDLQEIFNPKGENGLMKDSTNAGYIHAPSINQALTAAVLRNAYISNASKDQPESFKVNLSSERVRQALSIIEGMQQGQSLGALLGYQLERGLHDNTDEELDIYIYELRKIFPLGSNRLKSTEIREGKTGSTPEEQQRFQEEEEEFTKDKAVTKIEARNVVDGLALLDYIKEEEEKAPTEAEKKKIREYPFGIPEGEGAGKLMPANDNQKKAINAQVLQLMNIRDAVADLAMAESVHQVVQGNYDRAAGALDAYSKGNYPQLPDVIQTPGSGVSLTNRFGIHLPISPVTGSTPRSKAEPAINKWLEDLFPNLSDICCKVEYRIPNYEEGGAPNPATKVQVTMSDLGLLPIDLLYMLDVESEKNLTALDDCILKFIHETESPRPDIEMEIGYTDPIEGKFTFFQMAPLVRDLRALIVSARPLLPTDMMLQNEAKQDQNVSCAIDPNRIINVKSMLDGIAKDLAKDFLIVLLPFFGYDLKLISVDDMSSIPVTGTKLVIVAKHVNTLHIRVFDDAGAKVIDKSETDFPDKSAVIENLKTILSGLWDRDKITIDQHRTIFDAVRSITDHLPLIDLEDFEITMVNKDKIIDHLDTLFNHFINHLQRLNQFGLPQTGFGFIYDRKSAIYAAIYKKVLDYKKRWEEKKAIFDDLMLNQFPVAPPEEQISILQKAERTISTEYSFPVPTVNEYLDILNGTASKVGKKALFDDKFNELETFLNSSFLGLKDLMNEVSNLKTDLETFDLLTIETDGDERQIVVLAEDLKIQAEKLHADISAKSSAIQDLLDTHDTSAEAQDKVQALTKAVKLLFGEDFQIIPEFSLSVAHANELQNCLNNQSQLLSFQKNDQANDFPVDEWLYGIARVREKMAAWENLVMLAEAFKNRQPLNLTPLQLPFNADDSWLGLEYPDDFVIDNDKLLYAAYLHLPGFDATQRQCGLLVDEWTEVIPAKKETTGLTFHYDIPNCEAPQTLLLVTPPAFTGSWKWQDLVNTLHETLNLAKLRAIEPDEIDKTRYAQLLPATVAAVTTYPVTIALNYMRLESS